VYLVGLFDLESNLESSHEDPEKYGLPILGKKDSPKCSIAEPALGPCSRKRMLIIKFIETRVLIAARRVLSGHNGRNLFTHHIHWKHSRVL
jgi:hypothetical protein